MRCSVPPPPPIDPALPEHPLGAYVPSRRGRPPSRPSLPTCRGGRAYVGTAGYVLERSPDHPRANSWGDVPQHRLVMECLLGRLLGSKEIVHHEDEVRANNHPSNLALHTPRSHHLLHHKGRWLAPLTEVQVREALEGRTTQQAATVLGVHPQTLRNRFGHLLEKRRSPQGAFPEDFVRQVRVLAQNPAV